MTNLSSFQACGDPNDDMNNEARRLTRTERQIESCMWTKDVEPIETCKGALRAVAS